ncbi:glycosyltransferase family 4 protein [Sediminitomix flava]|uniref:Glycosyltransferase involved in cell wall biosynthesis n=1 Tax=Sediminitomix flava TaxID=379075 RepID=A0A315ZEN4_SEDFL|nr:glycosyltransferase family 4 protein [Sediminitomix flava]PWJ43288.1 glycosyltransferase involved in cell wall biosynthesis [Sediminitomix flava]
MNKNKAILILAPYPKSIAPSQRFRFEQYLEQLEKEGLDYDYIPFLDLATWKVLHQAGNFGSKAWGILRAFLKRFNLLFSLTKYKYVFIHREASHIGPPIFEFLIAKVFRKKLIYDFDDAIWLPNYSEHNAKFHWLKMYGKVNYIMKWAYKVSVGNKYLGKYASQYNSNIVINPTTIDTEYYHNPELYKKALVNELEFEGEIQQKPVIGWTGTLTTAKYLDFLIPVLQKLEENYDFEFRVISNEKPKWDLKSLVYQDWKKETEIEDLCQFDIGVMPLTDDIWAKGKCGFKALQYMALEVPAIVSPVGVNTEIVDHSLNGFICTTTEEWYLALKELLDHPHQRNEMGLEARKKIIDYYSVLSNAANVVELFS